MIYLDNAATTRMDARVLDAMLPYMLTEYGNPESVHAAAKAPKEAVLHAEKQVHEFLHTGGKGKVIFTSGGTEANNMAFGLSGWVDPLCINIITSASEHKSVLEPAKTLQSSAANTLTMLNPGKKGYISVKDFPQDELSMFTLVSFMHMNNETGAVNDIYGIGRMLRQFGDKMNIFFHVDCVQSAGELPILAEDMKADLISVSSHKIHGPKGVGCLWISDRALERIGDRQCLSLIRGGGQQSGFRAGTLNVPGIVGFGEAAEIAGRCMDHQCYRLSQQFKTALAEECKKVSVKHRINYCNPLHHTGKILSITFPKADAETVVLIASRNGLCISAGAACNATLSEPSYVLTSCGMTPEMARRTVRVSFSRMNSQKDCEEGARILAESVSEAISLTGALE